jgi:peptidyl-prolyl cis-trans isomerase D
VKSFAEVRPGLLADFQKKQGEDKYYALGDQLANMAYEHHQSLDEVSKQFNLPIQVATDVTKEGGPGIAGNPDVRKAAFSDEVLTQGNNSAPIQIGPDHVVVIRVKGHEPSAPMPLVAVKDKIAAIVKQQHASDATAKLAATLLDELKKGQDPAAVAKTAGAGVSLVSPGFVTREQKAVAPGILSAAFAAPQPAAGARSYATASLDGGDMGVLVVSGVKPGETADMKDTDRLMALRGLSRADGTTEFSAYLAYLKQQAKVEINTKNLDQSDQ